MVGLEGIRWPLVQGRMLPIVVVSDFQEVREVRDDVRHGAVPARVDLFVLQGLPEALDVGIVIRIAGAGHGAEQARLGQSLAVAPGRILGGFNRSSQQQVLRQILDIRSAPLPASSILTFCAAYC